MAKQTILVTGASGYIASFIVKDLLEHGYRVRGTVRSLEKKPKYDFLYNLQGAKDNLELVEADLLKEGSFDEHAKGVDSVFHTASPFFFSDGGDPYKAFINPALQGTRNVLNAAYKNKDTVKRVVVTSSVAAIFCKKDQNPPVFTEKDWNNVSSPSSGSYAYSKTLAEKETWKMVNEWQQKHGTGNVFDLVTVNPGLVTGPILHARRVKEYGLKELNQSCEVIRKLLIKGFNKDTAKEKVKASESFPIVDVRDVAKAHRLAYEVPEASGNRHICVVSKDHWVDILPKLKKDLEGNSKVSIVTDYEGNIEEERAKSSKFDNSQTLKRLKGFGLFIPAYDSVLATANSLIENDLL